MEMAGFSSPPRTIVCLVAAMLFIIDGERMMKLLPYNLAMPTQPAAIKTLWRSMLKILVVKHGGGHDTAIDKICQVLVDIDPNATKEVKMDEPPNQGDMHKIEDYLHANIETSARILETELSEAQVLKAMVPAQVLYVWLKIVVAMMHVKDGKVEIDIHFGEDIIEALSHKSPNLSSSIDDKKTEEKDESASHSVGGGMTAKIALAKQLVTSKKRHNKAVPSPRKKY